jgi:hypothetical protein
MPKVPQNIAIYFIPIFFEPNYTFIAFSKKAMVSSHFSILFFSKDRTPLFFSFFDLA